MYIILELQATDTDVAIVPPVKHQTRAEAEQAYHQALAYAAVSAVPVHSVLLMTGEGQVLRSESYKHGGDNESE